MIKVVKRNGEREPLDVEKMHRVLEWACEDLSGVSVSDVEMRSHIQFYDGILTSEINDITISAAEDLISVETPNYQYVAARLMVFDLRKKVFGSFETKRLIDIVKENVAAGVYDPMLLEWYSDDDWIRLGSAIKHDRDFKLTAAAMKQIKDKYLIQDRSAKKFYETPQVAFLMIAATAFHKYPKETRHQYVRDMYDAISKFQVSLPTPILGGLRSVTRQFSSCVLIDSGDSLESITDAAKTMTKYASKRAGLGINGGRIRALGSKVGTGEVVHTGVVPYYRMFESAIKSCSQGGIRDASATLYAPIWHREIEDIMVLKNNKGTHESRVRRLDYAIQWDSYLIRRALKKEDIALFSPGDVPDLYDAFFEKDRSRFAALYEKYEKDFKIKKKMVNGRELLTTFLKESQETGRLYAFLADNVNTHTPFLNKIVMSNLCVTGDAKICVSKNPNGNDSWVLELQELSEVGWEDLYVLSRGHNGSQLWKRILDFAQTSAAAQVMKITDLESGLTIKCTPDHIIFTKNRGEVKAADLNEKDQLELSDYKYLNTQKEVNEILSPVLSRFNQGLPDSYTTRQGS